MLLLAFLPSVGNCVGTIAWGKWEYCGLVWAYMFILRESFLWLRMYCLNSSLRRSDKWLLGFRWGVLLGFSQPNLVIKGMNQMPLIDKYGT